jgi:phosphoenolpyruvate carboxylase
MKERKISATMATQHPDHAAIPLWHTEAFISNRFESYELFLAFSELGISEYKWDWEGKLVDESVLERLFGEHFDFFKKNPLGKKTFLTFRLPNPKVEMEFRLGRAFMNLSSAASIAKHFQLPTPPLFEVILPMTETPEEILAIQEAFQEMHHLIHPLYRLDHTLTNLRIIPLFEQVSIILDSDRILKRYFSLYKKRFHKLPPYFRPYVARSDPALNSGLIPTVLAIKIALSKYKKLEEDMGFPLYPIIGAAALPFRGGITPLTITDFINEYHGIRTTTIQSAFRYDFKKKDVIAAIATLERLLPEHTARTVSSKDEKVLLDIIVLFEQYYKHTIESIAPLINTIALYLPKRRERVQHIGLFGYSRGVGKVKLPRAISFTGSLYSLGIPPELIGTGRGIKQIKKEGKLAIVEKHYINLKQDLLQSGKFLNKKNLQSLAKFSSSWKDILYDVDLIEAYLGMPLEPKTGEEKEHEKLTSKIYEHIKHPHVLTPLIEQAAILRKSLG